MTRSCETCEWWMAKPGPLSGECRGAPPTINQNGGRSWPLTSSTDWCGAWRMAERVINPEAKR